MIKSRLFHKVFILMLLFALFAVGCANKPAGSTEISLSDLQVVNNPKEQRSLDTLRVAFSAINSPKETITYYHDLLKYIENNTGLTVQVIQRKTYKEINDLLEAGEVDLAFICTYAYVLGTEDFGLQPFLVPQTNGKTTYQSYILVPKDSTVSTFKELKGKRFAFTDPLSNSGCLYPKYLVKQEGTTVDNFFSKTIYTYSHDNSIEAVFEKIVDGAAVDSLVYDYLVERKREYKDKIRIIETSPEFGIPPIVVSLEVSPEIRERLKDLFLNMHKTEEGKVILDHLKIDRFWEQDDADYDFIRNIAKEVLDGK